MQLALRIAAVLLMSPALVTSVYADNGWVRVKGGSWEPPAKVLNEIRAGLEPYTRAEAKNLGRELRNWREYTFQYRGHDEKGRKVVTINAICRPDTKLKLEEDFYFVRDGGSCYFRLKYDPTRRQFYELMINGDA